MEATRIVYNCSTGLTEEEIFTMPPANIDELKQQKKQEINLSFDTQINTGTTLGYLTKGLTVNVHVYDSKQDLENYKTALTSMDIQGLTERQIKVKEPEPFIFVTKEELQTIINELIVYSDSLWVKKQNLYKQIDAKTQEDLDAAISSGDISTLFQEIVW